MSERDELKKLKAAWEAADATWEASADALVAAEYALDAAASAAKDARVAYHTAYDASDSRHPPSGPVVPDE
jgi:hypothetical protein